MTDDQLLFHPLVPLLAPRKLDIIAARLSVQRSAINITPAAKP